MYKDLYFNKAGDTVYNRAEGATYPETLRQRDRRKNTLENELLALPKVQVSMTKLSGTMTDG